MIRPNLASACPVSRLIKRASVQAALPRPISISRLTHATAFSTIIDSMTMDLVSSAEASGTGPAAKNYPTCRG